MNVVLSIKPKKQGRNSICPCVSAAITKQALMALTAPKINCVDFCHDSAKQASLMALTAPKIENLGNF